MQSPPGFSPSFDGLPDAVIASSLAGEILYLNRAAETTFGLGRKADPLTRDVVIALTAYVMKGDEERVLAAGCDAYIGKPIDTRRLAAQVADLLTRPGNVGAPVP